LVARISKVLHLERTVSIAESFTLAGVPPLPYSTLI
jgi:hypothetical protein